MKNYKLLLFDFDYTLVDSSEGIVACMKYAFSNIGDKIPTDSTIKQTIGKSLEESFHELCTINQTDKYDAFRAYFMQCSKQVMSQNAKVFDDTSFTLKTLKQRNITIGIISSKDQPTIRKISNKHGFLQFIDFIIGEDDVVNQKPNPEQINKAIKLVGIENKDVLYVGDSIVDAYTAVNAGVDFLPVLTGMTSEEKFITLPQIGIIHHLHDVLKFCK